MNFLHKIRELDSLLVRGDLMTLVAGTQAPILTEATALAEVESGFIETEKGGYIVCDLTGTEEMAEAAARFFQQAEGSKPSPLPLPEHHFVLINDAAGALAEEIAEMIEELQLPEHTFKETAKPPSAHAQSSRSKRQESSQTDKLSQQPSQANQAKPKQAEAMPRSIFELVRTHSRVHVEKQTVRSEAATKEPGEKRAAAAHEQNAQPRTAHLETKDKPQILQEGQDPYEREEGQGQGKGQDEQQEEEKNAKKNKKQTKAKIAPLNAAKTSPLPSIRANSDSHNQPPLKSDSVQEETPSIDSIYIRFMALMARILGQAEYEGHQLYLRIKARTDDVDTLTQLLSKINLEKKGIDWTKNEEMQQLVDKARAIGVEIPEGKLKWSEDEKKLLKENIQMRKDSMEKITQLERTDMQRYLQEASQCHQARSNILKMLKEVTDTIIHNMRPG